VKNRDLLTEIENLKEKIKKLQSDSDDKSSLSNYDLKIIAENSPDAIFITDKNGKYLYVNKAASDLLGYSFDELIKKNITEIAADGEKSKKKERFRYLLKEGKLFTEINLKRKDNSIVPVDLNAVVLPNGLVYGSCRDLTQRKRMQEILTESEEKYRSLYENTPISYQSLNGDGKLIDVNPEWLRVLGYEREEVIGKWFGDFLHSDSRSIFKKNFPLLKKRGNIYNVNFKMKLRGEGFLDILLDGHSGYNPDGSFKQTYCTFKDITLQKEAEAALKKSEIKYTALFNDLNDAVFIHNYKKEGFSKFIEVNDSACEKYGYTREEFLKLSPADIADFKDVKLRGSAKERLKLFKNKWITFEAIHVSRDKKTFPVEISAKLFELEGKTIEMSIARDITERKKTEEALKKHQNNLEKLIKNRTNELEEKNEQLERFYDAAIDREFRVKELLDKIENLKKDSGQIL